VPFEIVVVSRDPAVGVALRQAFRRRRPRVATHASVRGVRRALERPVDLVVVDLDLRAFPARGLLSSLISQKPDAAAIVVAGRRALPRALRLTRETGHDLVAKPASRARLRRAANLAATRRRAQSETRDFVDRLAESNQLLADTQSRLRQRILAQNRELLSLQELSDRIFQVLGSGLLVLDEAGRVTRLNAAAQEILRIDEEGALGRHARDVFHALDHAPLDAAAGGDAEPFDDEVTIETEDGRQVPVLLRTSHLRDETGRAFGLVANFSDLTRLKRQDQELRRVERLASLGELSAGMAHELRNPLAGIEMTAELIAKRLSRDDASRSLTAMIIEEVRRLNRLIEAILRFARPSPPQFSSQAIPALLDRCVSLLTPKLHEKQIVLERDDAAGLPLVDLDPSQISQVFLNLIKNAVEASPYRGTVRVAASLQEKGEPAGGALRTLHVCRIEIEDEGPGIPAAKLEDIWNPFYTTKSNGTGLGLPICQRIVHEHRGRIVIESRGGARGARAVVELPIPLYGKHDLPTVEAIERLSDVYG
jgi:two-component system nitrogen regulation sensor histidine kinase GlnL